MTARVLRYVLLIEKNFLFLVLLSSIAALFFPVFFLWVKPHIPKFLGLIMFGMGVTLKFSDFMGVWKKKRLVFLGVVMQYALMPALAVVISLLFHLPKELMIGMVIVGSCPGGTASNVIAYMAKADVALSVTLTLCSTMLAPLLTPGIIYLILSHKVAISLLSMMKSVFWIVLFPLID
jgi:BASS family bile acid:Na+ symporter